MEILLLFLSTPSRKFLGRMANRWQLLFVVDVDALGRLFHQQINNQIQAEVLLFQSRVKMDGKSKCGKMCHLSLIFIIKHHMHLFLLLLLHSLFTYTPRVLHSAVSRQRTLVQRVQKLRICGAFSLHLLLVLLLFFLFVRVAHSLLTTDFTFLWRNARPRAAIDLRAFACNQVIIAGWKPKCFLARRRGYQIKAQPHVGDYWQPHLVFRLRLSIHSVGRLIQKIGRMLVSTNGINTISQSKW